jgi:hypothetical protein
MSWIVRSKAQSNMTTFPISPRLLKGGIVLIDPQTSAVLRGIALQYNPDTLSRMLHVRATGDGNKVKRFTK